MKTEKFQGTRLPFSRKLRTNGKFLLGISQVMWKQGLGAQQAHKVPLGLHSHVSPWDIQGKSCPSPVSEGKGVWPWGLLLSRREAAGLGCPWRTGGWAVGACCGCP